jgi:hypothetical protein
MEAPASRRGRSQTKYVTAVWDDGGFYADPAVYLAELPHLGAEPGW